MGTVNKVSLREEFDRLKTSYNDLEAKGKVNKDVKVLIQGLISLLDILVAIFLEKTTKKNSSNSSLPPSQTKGDDDTSNTQKGSNGKGKPENNNMASNTKTTTNVTTIEVTVCEICGKDLSDTPCCGHERRTRKDIIFEMVVDHFDAEIKKCGDGGCGAVNKGKFPDDIHGPLQYGNGLKAYALDLLINQMVSINRVQKLIKAMTGEKISEATLLKWIIRLYESLEGWEAHATEELLLEPTMNVDETSLRVDKKKQWIHGHSGGDITLKFLHPKRGMEAIEDINIIPRYDGYIIHDCWPSYFAYDHCGHGLCGSHLLRELTFIVESNGYAWAANMKRLLKEMRLEVASKKRKALTKKEYANYQKRYRNILTRGKKEMPEIPEKPKGKKGKIAKSDAHNLWERMKKHEAATECVRGNETKVVTT